MFNDFPITDKFGMDRYLFHGQCMDSCPEAYFHTQQKTCEACPEHCQLCTSATRCVKCGPSYYLNHGACARLECGEGQRSPAVSLSAELLSQFLLPKYVYRAIRQLACEMCDEVMEWPIDKERTHEVTLTFRPIKLSSVERENTSKNMYTQKLETLTRALLTRCQCASTVSFHDSIGTSTEVFHAGPTSSLINHEPKVACNAMWKMAHSTV